VCSVNERVSIHSEYTYEGVPVEDAWNGVQVEVAKDILLLYHNISHKCISLLTLLLYFYLVQNILFLFSRARE
jgi:hypothetical protein